MIRSVYNHHSSNDSSNKSCILYMLVGVLILHDLHSSYFTTSISLKYSCIRITILPMLSVNYLRGNYSIILHHLTSSLSCGEPVSYILPCDPFSRCCILSSFEANPVPHTKHGKPVLIYRLYNHMFHV